MSLYNMINGVSPAVFLILPMLGKHPDEYPRFRDCLISNRSKSFGKGIVNTQDVKGIQDIQDTKESIKGDDNIGLYTEEEKDIEPADEYKIVIFTRTGGSNREFYKEENQRIMDMDNYIGNHDWEGDDSYAVWYFDVPKRWRKDFNIILSEKMKDIKKKISNEYREQIYRIYPKIKDTLKGFFEENGLDKENELGDNV